MRWIALPNVLVCQKRFNREEDVYNFFWHQTLDNIPIRLGSTIYLHSENKFHKIWYTKVSFFWDQIQDMSLSGFPLKEQSTDWLIFLVYQLEAFFWQETTWTHVLTQISEKTDFR